jgi:hypothetical protein
MKTIKINSESKTNSKTNSKTKNKSNSKTKNKSNSKTKKTFGGSDRYVKNRELQKCIGQLQEIHKKIMLLFQVSKKKILIK